MSSFTKPLIVSPLPDGISWELQENFVYWIGKENSGEGVFVPKGFRTDFASIPKIFWSIIGGPTGRYTEASVIHDFLYVKGIYTRKRTDQIFYEAMTILKVSYWKRKAMYFAVRIGAFKPWRNYREKDNKM